MSPKVTVVLAGYEAEMPAFHPTVELVSQDMASSLSPLLCISVRKATGECGRGDALSDSRVLGWDPLSTGPEMPDSSAR